MDEQQMTYKTTRSQVTRQLLRFAVMQGQVEPLDVGIEGVNKVKPTVHGHNRPRARGLWVRYPGGWGFTQRYGPLENLVSQAVRLPLQLPANCERICQNPGWHCLRVAKLGGHP